MIKKIIVNDKMQQHYIYYLSEPEGQNFRADFKPQLQPQQVLALGVFGGKYITDCQEEFPASWFETAKLSPQGYNVDLNYFGVKASQSLSVWREKGWIHPDDPRGWFQWYCRYYRGRRISEEDDRQIKRWRAMTRHIGQLKKHCLPADLSCRPKQRQVLLHWAYDSRSI